MNLKESIPYHQILVPEKKDPLGTILILHGMQEHSGRYLPFAKYLNSKGWIVLLYDHLGHGNTAKSEMDSGFFRKKDPKQALIDDGKKMSAILKKEYPNLPHFILGHSMGSFITRCVLQEASSEFDGAVILGSGGKVKGLPILNLILRLLNSINPRKKAVWDKVFTKVNNKKFKKEDDYQGKNWLSLSHKNRDAFIEDPLCGRPFSNNGYYGLISTQIRATKRYWAKNIGKDLPILFISGQDDPIGDFGKGVQTTFDNLKKDGFQDVQIKLYLKMRHEILNEEINEEVYSEISNWLESKL